jgi:hypothetical protein
MKKLLLFLFAATSFAQTATISLVSSNTFKNYTNAVFVPSITTFGAIPNDGLSDDLALQTAQARLGTFRISQGTFDINTNFTLIQTNTVILDAGANLKPASGIVISISGGLIAPLQQVFDISAGGRFIFPTVGVGQTTRVPIIYAEWWGIAKNAGSTDDSAKFQAWLSSTPDGSRSIHGLTAGTHRSNAQLVVSNRCIIQGFGTPTIQGIIPANSALIKLADGSDDVKIFDLNLSADTGSGTNCFAINVGLDCDRVIGERLGIGGKFYGGGIYNSGNSLFLQFRNVAANGLNNSITNGGNGLLPSAFLVSTNVISQSLFENIYITSSDQAYRIHGGATTNSGLITIRGGDIESLGAGGLTISNTVQIENVNQLNMESVHMEKNGCVNVIYAKNSKQLNLFGCTMQNDFSSVLYATNSIFVDGVYSANVFGGRFNNCASNFVVGINSSNPVYLRGAYFDLGGIGPTTDANVLARCIGPVVYESITGVMGGSLTKAERNALASPFNNQRIYQTDSTPGPRIYVGGAWYIMDITADP